MILFLLYESVIEKSKNDIQFLIIDITYYITLKRVK